MKEKEPAETAGPTTVGLPWESSHTSHPALQYSRVLPQGLAAAESTE